MRENNMRDNNNEGKKIEFTLLIERNQRNRLRHLEKCM